MLYPLRFVKRDIHSTHTHTTNTHIHVHILLFSFFRENLTNNILHNRQILNHILISTYIPLWPSLLQLDTWIKHNWFSNFPLSYASFSHNISNLLNMLYEPSSSWSSGQARSGWPILSWSITWMKDNGIILPYKSNYKSHGVNLKLHQWDFFF